MADGTENTGGDGFLKRTMGLVGFGGDSANANNNNADTNSNKSGEEDNNKDNIDNNKSIWDNKDTKVDEQENKQNQQQQQQEQQNAKSPEEQLQAHMDSLNLMNNVDVSKIQEELQTGNTESLEAALKQVSENTYQNTMTQMNALIDKKIDAGVNKATANSTASINAGLAEKAMAEKLPYTTGKDVAPVANAALAQFIKNGSSVEEAIEGVSKFFDATASAITENDTPPANRTGGQGFGASNNNQGGETQINHDDWLDVLTNQN